MDKTEELEQIVNAINATKLSEEQKFDLYEYGTNKRILSDKYRWEIGEHMVKLGTIDKVQRVDRLINTTTSVKVNASGKGISGVHSKGYFVRPSDQDVPLPPENRSYNKKTKVDFCRKTLDFYVKNKLTLERVTREDILASDIAKELGIDAKNWSTLRETANPVKTAGGKTVPYRFRYKESHVVYSDDPKAMRSRTPQVKG